MGSFNYESHTELDKEYISLDLEPDEIASKLTMAGLEVDAVENLYEYLQEIVVAKVLEVRNHPNADKLSCCVVDTGSKNRHTLSVVRLM